MNFDHSKKLLTTHEKRGDGSTRAPVLMPKGDEARRHHEPTQPVRGENAGRRRTRNDKVQRPVPPAVNPDLEDEL